MAEAMLALMTQAKANTSMELRSLPASSGRTGSAPLSSTRPSTATLGGSALGIVTPPGSGKINHSPVKALSGSGLGGQTIALLQDMRPSARGRAFIDPVSVGAYLAAEGRVARVQAAHRQALARGRGDDSDDEENGADDGAAGGAGSSNSHSRVQARPSAAAAMAANAMGLPVPGSSGAPPELRLKRRMQGVLTDEFYGCLRATEREVSAEAEDNRQAAAEGGAVAVAPPAATAASTTAASTGPSLLFDAGPLTRALHAKQAAAVAEAQRREASKREAHLRKLRPSTAKERDPKQNPDRDLDDTTSKFNRLRADLLMDEDAVEDEHDDREHHRLCMPHICVPPTITYRKGSATAWYFSSASDGSVKRKHARNLTPHKIVACMDAVQYRTAWQAQRPLDVVAVFYFSEAHQSPLYLDREGLGRFVNTDADRLRCTGVLQKFVPPAAESNSMLRVSWTPRMCLVEKRTSTVKLDARRLGMEERVQTYEVNTGLGVEVREEAVHDSSSLRRTLEQTCMQIAEHFQIVHGYTMAAQQARVISAPASGSSGGASNGANGNSPSLASRPVKMTLYLKLAGQGQLFLLLCDELKWSRADPEVVERSLGMLGAAGVGGEGNPAARAAAQAAQVAFQQTQQQLQLHQAQQAKQLALLRHGQVQDEKESLLMASLETPQSTALLNACAARRRAIDAATRARSRAAARLAHAALHGHSASGPLDRRQKRGDVKCGHCRVTLTSGNSALSATSGATLLPSGAVSALDGAGSNGGGKPYLDLHSVLLYRLTLCLHLLPAAPPPGSNFPPAHWSNLQTIRSAFFWNLARAILVPAYMDDEKELKVHLILDEARRMAKHKEQVKRAAILAGRNPAEEDDGPVLLASPSAAAVGTAGVAASKSTASSASIWDTRIYVCRSCSGSIRQARKSWSVPGGGPIQRVFDTLLDAYIEHERLRDAPPEPQPTMDNPNPQAHIMSPRFIAAHARSLARLHLGPKDGTKKEVTTPLSSIYIGPPLRSPNPGIPLPPPLVAPPTLDDEGELSWPVHLSSSSAPIRVELKGSGGDGSDGNEAASFAFAGGKHDPSIPQAIPDPVEAWMDPHAPPGEVVRALLQEDALNPSAKTTSLLEELTAGLDDGPGVHLSQAEREEARRAREEARKDRLARQQAAELEAHQAEIRAAMGQGAKYKARHFAHVHSKLLETPEEALARRQRELEGEDEDALLRSSDDEGFLGRGMVDDAVEDEALLTADEEAADPEADSPSGKLSRLHERILSRLARVDPVRATLLREKAEPGAGLLSPKVKVWTPDTKLRARVEEAVKNGSKEQQEADAVEWDRVKQQLRDWQRKHQAKLAAARVRIAELAAADAERARPKTATLVAAERRLRASQSSSALLVSASLEAPPSPPPPPFDTRTQVSAGVRARGALFGDPLPIEANHAHNFKPYLLGERIYISSYDTLAEKGGMGYGAGSRSPSGREHSPARRAAAGSPGRGNSPGRRPGTAGSASVSASADDDVWASTAVTPVRSKPAIRASSAHASRRAGGHLASSSIDSTAPPVAGSPAHARAASAALAAAAAAAHARSGSGFDNIAVFGGNASAYTQQTPPRQQQRGAMATSSSASMGKLKFTSPQQQRPATAHSRLGGFDASSPVAGAGAYQPALFSSGSPMAASQSPTPTHAQRLAASPLAHPSNTAAARKRPASSHARYRRPSGGSSASGSFAGSRPKTGEAGRRPLSSASASSVSGLLGLGLSVHGGSQMDKERLKAEEAVESRLAAAEDIDDAPIFSSDDDDEAAKTKARSGKKRAGKTGSSWSTQAEDADAQKLIEEAEKKLFAP